MRFLGYFKPQFLNILIFAIVLFDNNAGINNFPFTLIIKLRAQPCKLFTDLCLHTTDMVSNTIDLYLYCVD